MQELVEKVNSEWEEIFVQESDLEFYGVNVF